MKIDIPTLAEKMLESKESRNQCLSILELYLKGESEEERVAYAKECGMEVKEPKDSQLTDYSEVWITMSKQELFDHIVKVCADFDLVVAATWYGSGDSGSLEEFSVEGDRSAETIKALKCTRRHEWTEETGGRYIVESRPTSMCVETYLEELVDALGDKADVDWYNNEGGSLELKVNFSWREEQPKETFFAEYYNQTTVTEYDKTTPTGVNDESNSA